MNSPSLTLKNPRGWFAAGVEVEKALTLLSDGAFKLFIFLCLNARRQTGVLETTQTELARRLHKGPTAIRAYLREMAEAGVCRSHFFRNPASRGRVEVTPDYWPYPKAEPENLNPKAETFVSTLKQLLEAHACIQAGFSHADEILAHHWFQSGISLDHLEQAILLGAARKYAAWRNHPRQNPIRSLHYFQPLLEELNQQVPDPDYWNYLRSRIQRMEKLWKQGHPPAPLTVEPILTALQANDPSPGGEQTAPHIVELRPSSSQPQKGDDDDSN